MDNLVAYDSDESGDEQDTAQQTTPASTMATAGGGGGGGGGGMLGALPAPSASKQRRVFELPLPKPKGSTATAVTTEKEDDDSDDDDKFLKNAKKKGSGLLAMLPAPKKSFGSVKETVSTTANDNAYEEALAKKQQKPARAAGNSLFDKQLQQKREEEARKAKEERENRAAEAAGGDHVTAAADAGGAVTDPSVTAPYGGGASDVTAPYSSLDGATTGYAPQAAASNGQGQLPPGWAAQWDDNVQAYYYYNTAGQTQWEPPVAAGGGGGQWGGAQEAEGDLPEELKRELKKQKRSAAMRGEQIPTNIPLAVGVGVKTIGHEQLFQGEKHREYSSAAAAYHVPMSTGGITGPSTLAKRKHQITDVLHNAAANELKYLDAASQGRKSKTQVNARYGW